MTLSDLPLPIDYEQARQYALVFSPQLAERLAVLHRLFGNTNCVPVPMPLGDGRLALCADLLTEVQPGGLLHAMWEAADKSVLMAEVAVIPWDDAVYMWEEYVALEEWRKADPSFTSP